MDAPRRVVGLGLRALCAFAVVACGTSQVSPGASLGTATAEPPAPTQPSTGAPLLSPGGGRPADELFGDWRLVAGQNGGTPIPLLAAFPVSLTISLRRVSGQSACNNYQADASVDAVNFGISTPAMSAMGCDPPRGAIDDAYISALLTVETWQIDGGQLFLRGPNVELQFAPE